MDVPVVSVIIPVYKAERFLDECLNSIIGQDYPALEIMMVDDGAPDICRKMCDQYREAYSYIKTIHKSNEGPGRARNAGLEVATGKYVIFVDSDDCLDGVDAIKQLVEQAEKKQADIVVGSFRKLNGQEFSGVNHHRLEDGAYTETVDFRFKGFVLNYHLAVPWCKLYRRTFLTSNGLKFPDYPFGEDKGFNMMCCTYHPVYAFVDESVYLYRVDNGDSTTHRYFDDFASIWITAASDFELFLSERGIAEEYGDLLAFHLCFGLVTVAARELRHKGLLKAMKILSRYVKNPLVQKMVKRLVHGRYIDQIDRKEWKAKVMIWGASLLCSLHAYVVLSLGIWVLQMQKVKQTKSL